MISQHMVLSKHMDQILATDEIQALPQPEREALFDQFRKCIKKDFQIDPACYASLANVGQAILNKEGCFTGTCMLCGPVGEFIRLCQTPPLCEPRCNEPVKVEGEIIQLDRRGSYCAVYADFEGIPYGEPMVITKFKPDTGSSRYYYVCLDVEEFKYKLFQQHAPSERDPFPLLRKTGLLYLDKMMFEAIDARYDWKYKFISGYAFERGCNITINKVARALWAVREKIQPPILKPLVKRMINSLFGKSIMREKLTYTITYDLGEIPMFLRKGKFDDICPIKRRGNQYQVSRFFTTDRRWISSE
jgi:hypothetical protein